MSKGKAKNKRFEFGRINTIFMLLALVFIIVGYIILNSSPNFGTFLLIVGYIVLVPLSLLLKSGNRNKVKNNK